MTGACDQVRNTIVYILVKLKIISYLQAAVDACISVARSSKSEHVVLEAWRVLVKMLKECKMLTRDWEDLVGAIKQLIIYYRFRY